MTWLEMKAGSVELRSECSISFIFCWQPFNFFHLSNPNKDSLITKKIPKSLVKIKNKPIIWYILNILKKNHFNHFILPVGYKGNLLEKYFVLRCDEKDFELSDAMLILKK